MRRKIVLLCLAFVLTWEVLGACKSLTGGVTILNPDKQPHSYAYPCEVRGISGKMICHEVIEAYAGQEVQFAHGRMTIMDPSTGEIVATRYLEVDDNKPFDPSQQKIDLDDLFLRSNPDRDAKQQPRNSARKNFDKLLDASPASDQQKFRKPKRAKLTLMGLNLPTEELGDAGTLARGAYGPIRLDAVDRLNGFANQQTQDRSGRDCYEFSREQTRELADKSSDSEEYLRYLRDNAAPTVVDGEEETYVRESYYKMKIAEKFAFFPETIKIVKRNGVSLDQFVELFAMYAVEDEMDEEDEDQVKFQKLKEQLGDRRFKRLLDTLTEVVDQDENITFLEQVVEGFEDWEDANEEKILALEKEFQRYVFSDDGGDFRSKGQKVTVEKYLESINLLRSNLDCDCNKASLISRPPPGKIIKRRSGNQSD